MIGHRTASGWTIDAVVSNTGLNSTTDYKLGVSIKGSTISVTLNDQAAVAFVYNAVGSDGRFGLFARGASASFDTITVKTNDPVVSSSTDLLAAAPSMNESSMVIAVKDEDIVPIVLEAKQRWALSGLLDARGLALLDEIEVRIGDLDGLILGHDDGSLITIDRDAAGWGWFIDDTAGKDEEFLAGADGSLLAKADSEAYGRMDLLTVISHEIGHALGYTHAEADNAQNELMDATLVAGTRELPESEGVSYFDDEKGQFVQPDRKSNAVRQELDDFLVLSGQELLQKRQHGESIIPDDVWSVFIDSMDGEDDEVSTDKDSLFIRIRKMMGRWRH
jgi:hypothetical protein